ncbi:MAG TPA: ABC transporter permease [Ohtaekwangia sp.]|uniref:ABC transporter permease n=1 Tax=Ohtaekwangia sp. TaxID=2066019 RepID=UPI002F9579AD
MNRPDDIYTVPTGWLRFLQWFCPEHLYEGIAGDLQEEFDQDVAVFGRRKAKWRFTWNVLRFFRPGILFRNKFSIQLIQGYMLLNYFKIMLRSIAKRKVYSAITVLGLTIGIAFSLLIGTFIAGELQVNHQLSDVDRLYMMSGDNPEAANGIPFFSPSPLARLVKEQYPTLVENFYRFNDRSITVSRGDKHFRIQSIIGDTTFLSMFGFPLVYGDAGTALNEPRSILITEKIARQYFNRTDVVGESLTLATEKNGLQEYKITGVLQDLKSNTVTNIMDIGAQIVLPIYSLKDFNNFDPETWNGAQMISFIKRTPGASPQSITKAFTALIQKQIPAGAAQAKLLIRLDGLDDYYLYSNNKIVYKLIVTLSAIVVFILLLAVINFINITIGNSTVRLREIGVRKAVGGVKKQVITQFLSESIVFTVLAATLALGVYQLLRGYVGDIMNTPLLSVTEFPLLYWLIMGGITLVIGILAGIYPAFFLSSYKTLESLKGKIKSGTGGIVLSRSLVSIQFLLAICVFIASIIMTRQVSYFLDKDLGYDKSAIVTISSVPREWTPEGFSKMDAAKQKFMELSSVEAISLSWDIPNGNYGVAAEIYPQGKQPDTAIGMPILSVDEDFKDTYKMTMKDGTFFHLKGQVQQPDDMVINEAAQKAMNVHVGDRLLIKGAEPMTFRVAGVVADFNYFSLHKEVKPLLFMNVRNNLFPAFRFFSVKLQSGNIAQSLAAVEKRWREIFPNDPFEYTFMDQNLEKLYKTEIKMKKAAGFATALMLLIVLLGVFGLASLNVTRRTREIGIRKVLGATIASVLILIAREFVWLIIAAFIVAIPVTYYFIDQWLSTFAYHISLQWWMFAVPGILVFFIALLVVSGQSLRAALSNPVDALKTE